MNSVKAKFVGKVQQDIKGCYIDASRQICGAEDVLWKCPICLLFPQQEIFECRNGHSICNLCVLKRTHCLACRVPYGESKTRSFGLEEALDLFRIRCLWKGCSKMSHRRNLATHVAECDYKPSA